LFIVRRWSSALASIPALLILAGFAAVFVGLLGSGLATWYSRPVG
jgi:hypothetical protein